MLRAKIAERLLAFFTAPERAAALVGDLLELHSRPAAFCLAVMRTAFELSWRFGLGLLAAVLVECLLPSFLHSVSDQILDGMLVLQVACWTLLTASAVFASIRFGIFDATSSVAIALSVAVGFDLFLCPAYYVLPVVVILAACLTRRGRGALQRLLLAMVAGTVPMVAAVIFVLWTAFEWESTHSEFLIITLARTSFLVSSCLVAVVCWKGNWNVGILGEVDVVAEAGFSSAVQVVDTKPRSAALVLRRMRTMSP